MSDHHYVLGIFLFGNTVIFKIRNLTQSTIHSSNVKCVVLLLVVTFRLVQHVNFIAAVAVI